MTNVYHVLVCLRHLAEIFFTLFYIILLNQFSHPILLTALSNWGYY